MRIGVDIDNTVGDYLGMFCRHSNDEFGTDLCVEDMKAENVKFETDGLLTLEQALHVKSLDKQKLTFQKMPMFKDAKRMLRKLGEQSTIFFVSNRDNYEYDLMKNHTVEWLKRNGVTRYQDVIFTSKKGEVAKMLNLDVFIEDNYREVYQVKDHVKECYLIKKPWNKHLNLSGNVLHVEDWYEIEGKIRHQM